MQELNAQEVLEVGGGDEVVQVDESHVDHGFWGGVLHLITFGLY